MRHVGSVGILVLATGVSLLNGVPSWAQPGPLHSGVLFRLVGLPGRSSQGYLGVDLRSVTEEQAAVLKLKDVHGVEITGVDHDAPACKAGLQVHDVILQMNGHIIEGEEQLRRMLKETPAGRQVTFVISRDGQQRTIQTQLANREEVERQAWEKHYIVPEPPDSSSAYIPRGNSFLAPTKPAPVKGTHSFLGTSMMVSASYTGARLEVMGPQLAEFFGAQGGAGLLVHSVEPSSPAADAGMKAGDVVVKVNSVDIASASDWSKTIHENRGKAVNVVVLREKKEQTLTLVPDAKKRSSVEPWANLHGFFDNSAQGSEQINAAVAELDGMAAKMRRQLDQLRSLPEVRQMRDTLNDWSSDPKVQRQFDIARQQLSTAMETARLRMDSPELRDRMNSLRNQMRQAVGLN